MKNYEICDITMEESPPAKNLGRGLFYALLVGALCQTMLFAASQWWLARGEEPFPIMPPGIIDRAFPTVPVIAFGMCVGFATGYPAGRYRINHTALWLFASFLILGMCAIPGIQRPRREPEFMSAETFYAVFAMVAPTAVLIVTRMKHAEADRLNLSQSVSDTMREEDDDANEH